MQIEVSTRHGSLEPDQQTYLYEKAEKLLKYFGRLMAIEVRVEFIKHACQIEIFATAEHKHDFVAVEQAASPKAAMDQCVQKIEEQLRRYKERVQNHHGATPMGGTTTPLTAERSGDSQSRDSGEAS